MQEIKSAIKILNRIANNLGYVYCAMGFKYLQKHGYVYQKDNVFRMTTQGEIWLNEQNRNPLIITNDRKFKDEAMTGLCEEKSKASGFTVSAQSSMDNAVLSTAKTHIEHKTPEDMMMEQDYIAKRKRSLADRLNLSMSECEKMVKEGRIKICKQCGKPGIFDRKKDGWQMRCRDCMKIYRQRRRANSKAIRGNR